MDIYEKYDLICQYLNKGVNDGETLGYDKEENTENRGRYNSYVHMLEFIDKLERGYNDSNSKI